MHHKRKRPKTAGCFCKPGKAFGCSALRGSQRLCNMSARDDIKGGAGARLRLRARAMEAC